MSDEQATVNSETTLPPNVTDIKAGSSRKSPKIPADERPSGKIPSKVGLQQYLCGQIEERGNYRAFRGDRNDDKMRTLLQISADNVCRIVSSEYVGALLADYVQFMRKDGEEITHDQCTRAVRRWSWTTSRNMLTEWPAAMGFKSDGRLVFTRLPFDPEPFDGDLADHCPIFNGIRTRMGNWKAFCLRVAAIFDPEASRKQVVHVWGPTDGGKSFLQDLLQKLAGGLDSVADLAEENLRGSHWKAPLAGKSLILLREAPPGFFGSLQFKTLTGDRYHLINPKGLPQYQAKLDGLVFSCSNELPEIPSDESYRNRVILCRLDAVPSGEKLHEKVLMDRAMAEVPKFLWYCLELYAKHGKGAVSNDEAAELALEEAVEAYELPMQAIFDAHFVHCKGAKTSVTSSRFINTIRPHCTNGITIPKMREFVRQKYGAIVGHLVKERGHAARYVTEIAEKLKI